MTRARVRSSGPRTASTMQNSEAPSRAVSSAAASSSSPVEQGRGPHRRVEAGRLAAEVAVLGAAPGLARDDALHLDGRTAPGQAHLVGEGAQGRRRLHRQSGQTGQLRRGQQPALVEQGGGGGRQQVGHGPTIARSIA